MKHKQYIPERKNYDVCIVGAGPAGITIALKLAQQKKRVLLIEGGGLSYSRGSQNNYIGETQGDRYFSLKRTRLRFFGGSSNHWGGWCRELDSADFHPKGRFTQTGWPINKRDLDPYRYEAFQMLEIPGPPSDLELPGSGLNRIYFSYSRPIRFLDKYYDTVVNSPWIDLKLNHDYLGMDCDDQRIRAVRTRNIQGETSNFVADQYVLAMGGIENSRMLLWSDYLNSGRVLKGNRNIGRYWMEHPHFSLGKAILMNTLPFKCDKRHRMFFAPTTDVMTRFNILNASVRVREPTAHGIKKLSNDLSIAAPQLEKWAQYQAGNPFFLVSRVRASWEQEPRFENRVELSEQHDELGIPRSRLIWRKNLEDLKTIQVTARLFGEYLANTNLGRLKLDDWVLGRADYPADDELAGNHHMGGTRMASSPKDGVVDKNCRVFGQKNLYMAGSSIFTSGGYANPTLTIVQLALRLADHLGKS